MYIYIYIFEDGNWRRRAKRLVTLMLTQTNGHLAEANRKHTENI